MEELHDEGLASHIDPESCAGIPQGARRSVDRGTHRLGIEPRNQPFRDADTVTYAGRQHGQGRYRESLDGPARSETPRMCGTSLHENGEIPGSPSLCEGRIGKAKAATR